MDDSRKLRTRRPAPLQEILVIPPLQLSKQPMTNAQRSKRAYDRKKEACPEEYKQYLAKKAVSAKAYRDKIKQTITEEELEERRRLVRERVKKHRMNQKENPKPDREVKKSKPKPLTRHEKEKVEEKKKKDRERKKLERAGWSRQKKKAESQKAQVRREKKKATVASKNRTVVTEQSLDTLPPNLRSQDARKQALYRVVSALPLDPTARKETIADFAKKHSRFNAAVCNLLSKCSRPFVRKLTQHILSLDKDSRKLTMKRLGITRQRLYSLRKSNSLYDNTQARRSGPNPLRAMVRKFYEQNAQDSSEKKHVSSAGARKVLSDTVSVLFGEFKEQHPDVTLSRSFFFGCRPRHVKVASNTKLHQCLCEVCTNMDLKISAMHTSFSSFPHSKYDLMAKILCPKTAQFYSMKCIRLQCSLCGLGKLDDLLPPSSSIQVLHDQWNVVKVESKDKKVVTKKRLVPLRSSRDDLARGIKTSLEDFLVHHFTAKWQYSQFLQMKSKLDIDEVLMVYDFAENYRSIYQDEVQSAHWNYTQSTIHPVVCYYRCQCGETTSHSVVVISDDLEHDYCAVDTYLSAVYDLLSQRGVKIRQSIEWSDGCTAQYKSKGPFYTLQKNGGLRSFSVHRNFFGSRHGKNPSDGESAVIKSAATRAVLCRRRLIQDARDLYRFAKDSLTIESSSGCVHFQRSFIFVKSSSIIRKDKATIKAMKTMAGCRQVHSITSCNGTALQSRNLTCLCEGCRGFGGCLNTDRVGDWKAYSFPVAPELTQDDSLNVLSSSMMDYLEDLNESTPAITNQPDTSQISAPLDESTPAITNQPDTSQISAPLDESTPAITNQPDTSQISAPLDESTPAITNQPDTSQISAPLDESTPAITNQPDTSQISAPLDESTPAITNQPDTSQISAPLDESTPAITNQPDTSQISAPLDESTPAITNQPDTSQISAPLDESTPAITNQPDTSQISAPLGESTPAPEPKLKEGTYIEVILYDVNGARARHTFFGIVEAILHGEVRVRFMKEYRSGEYLWPEADDISLVPIYDIVRILPSPSIRQRNRTNYYQFF